MKRRLSPAQLTQFDRLARRSDSCVYRIYMFMWIYLFIIVITVTRGSIPWPMMLCLMNFDKAKISQVDCGVCIFKCISIYEFLLDLFPHHNSFFGVFENLLMSCMLNEQWTQWSNRSQILHLQFAVLSNRAVCLCQNLLSKYNKWSMELKMCS